MHEKDHSERLLTPKEVTQYYQISKPTLMRWVHDRGCPVVRLPGQFRFDPKAVASWIETLTAE